MPRPEFIDTPAPMTLSTMAWVCTGHTVAHLDDLFVKRSYLLHYEMMIVAIGWLFVVALFALAQFASPQGSLLVALLLVFGAGVLPLAVVLYVMGAPGRRRRRRLAEAAGLWTDPDAGGHAAGDAVAPKREEA
jgi:predicted membrane channel-forming protein YqfA (hemolysin III family)